MGAIGRHEDQELVVDDVVEEAVELTAAAATSRAMFVPFGGTGAEVIDAMLMGVKDIIVFEDNQRQFDGLIKRIGLLATTDWDKQRHTSFIPFRKNILDWNLSNSEKL